MSLRPMLYVADVQPLLDLRSMESSTIIDQVVDHFCKHLNNPDDQTLSLARTSAEGLLRQDASEKAESEDQANIVGAMASILNIQNESNSITDGDWKHQAWDDLLDDVEEQSPAVAPLYVYLLYGRPIFGSGIQSSWSYYAYLRLDEVRSLHEGLAGVKMDPGSELAEFYSELLDWLGTASKAEKDLWLFAS